MALSRAVRPSAARIRRTLAALVMCMHILCGGATSSVQAQSSPDAAANQLHAALVNGDVESLGYWLTVRHADASAATAAEPDVTPLERCLGLAARVLDEPSDASRNRRKDSNPSVSLRTLQDMVALLYEHGARLAEVHRRRFSNPVLRWYDDAVSAPSGVAGTTPRTKQPDSPQPPPAPIPSASIPPEQPGLSLLTKPVFITTNTRESCNGGGHGVYVVNRSQLSVTADVTSVVDTPKTNASPKRDRYTVDPESSWRLGCDTSKDGQGVRYILNAWR